MAEWRTSTWTPHPMFADADYGRRHSGFSFGGLPEAGPRNKPSIEHAAKRLSLTATGYTVQMPLWMIVVVTAVPALVAKFNQWRRNRRREAGLCGRCGYDTRASKDRCPECGTPVVRGSPVGQ